MPQFWWVNHKQTFRQEIDGQYLWSPKRSKPSARSGIGARNEFYNNMRRATPGDLVLSYANGLIAYVGRVVDFAFTSPKPQEFGKIGDNWSHDGWLLPVFWVALDPPIRPRDLLATLGPQLPKQHSPFNPSTGDGNQGAYLANISQAAFATVVASAAYDHLALARGGTNSLNFEVVTEILEDAVERHIAEDDKLDETIKKSVILARRGQGQFRARVSALKPACRLTGVANPSLLIASHIKPWRLCGTALERLDGMNGLMLTPDADLLFDRGFVSFEDNGKVLVSPRVDSNDLRRLGFEKVVRDRFGFAEAPAVWQTDSFAPPQCRYLDYHRSEVFINSAT